MADTSVQIYGFVNDTAQYLRKADAPATLNLKYSEIDQGACCASDQVNNMLVTPAIIPDPRPNRLGGGTLFTFNNTSLTADEVAAVQASLYEGSMGLVVDRAHVSDTAWNILNTNESVKTLFNMIEFLGNAQNIITKETTGTITDGSTAFNDSRIAAYKASLDAKYVVSTIGGFVEGVKTYMVGTTAITLKLAIRNYIEFTAMLGDMKFTFHIYWGENCFKQNYPITNFMAAVFPCERTKLFDLLTNYKTLNEFAVASSSYYGTQMNNFVSSGDQTGVYSFSTKYIATPESTQKNVMTLTFGLVYKGAAPILADAREFLANEILAITPSHTAEEWAEKFPDLFSSKRFFIIPFYGKESALTTDPNVFVHKAMYSLSEIETIVMKYLGNPEEHPYLTESENFEFLKLDLSGVLALVVPDPENPTGSKKISDNYSDLLTLVTTSPYVDAMSAPTKAFHNDLNAAYGAASQSYTGGVTVDHTVAGTKWVGFNPDGSSYYILTKGSYSA